MLECFLGLPQVQLRTATIMVPHQVVPRMLTLPQPEGPAEFPGWTLHSVDRPTPSTLSGRRIVKSRSVGLSSWRSTHNLARRFRSGTGMSKAPTPRAASPFKGKNPCKPMIAVEALYDYRETNDIMKTLTCSNAPRGLPELFVVLK